MLSGHTSHVGKLHNGFMNPYIHVNGLAAIPQYGYPHIIHFIGFSMINHPFWGIPDKSSKWGQNMSRPVDFSLNPYFRNPPYGKRTHVFNHWTCPSWGAHGRRAGNFTLGPGSSSLISSSEASGTNGKPLPEEDFQHRFEKQIHVDRRVQAHMYVYIYIYVCVCVWLGTDSCTSYHEYCTYIIVRKNRKINIPIYVHACVCACVHACTGLVGIRICVFSTSLPQLPCFSQPWGLALEPVWMELLNLEGTCKVIVYRWLIRAING